MSADGPQPSDWLAIAFLVEASLALSYEWKRLFQDYIVQLLQRCNIAPSPTKLMRVAFVTYGTADTQPTPIVKTIYFTELRHIIQDIKDDSRRLGIGQTDSGSGKGMAALEGFATILDMFDQLRNMGPKDSDCRVVHIAASPPDSSEHPHWNQSPNLDSLTWENLPFEFKKRNIQLSGINTSPGLPRFPELYTQAAAGNPTTPWFNVRTAHHLFINGFAPKAKRAAETVAPDRTPETKRARITPAQPSTDTLPPNSTSQTSPSAPPMQATNSTSLATTSSTASNVPNAPQSTSQPNPNLSLSPAVQAQLRPLMAQMHIILTKRKQVEEDVKKLLARRQAAATQGNTEQLSLCDAEIAKHRENYQRMTQALTLFQQQARRLQPQSQGATNPQGQEASQPPQPGSGAPQITRAVTSPSAPAAKDPQTPFNPATTPRQPSVVQSPNMNPQMTPGRSISTTGVPASTPNSNPSNPVPPMMSTSLSSTSGLNAQMQKLLQLDRNRQPQGMAPSTSAPAVPTSEGGMNNNPTPMVTNATPQPPQRQAQPFNASQIQSVLVWEGVLSFNGTGSDGNKKEVHTRVSASSSNASNSHSDTWPQSMILLPAQTSAVNIPDFQDWIRRTKPVLCTFKARTQEDETNYSMLVSVMSTKRMYATASWQLPNGTIKENVLIFPINNMGLCGAFFPLSGIPEMPKSTPTITGPHIPAAILDLVAQLPPGQRPTAIAQIRQKVAAGPEVAASFFRALLAQQQQQQQNAQNRAAMANQFGLNPTLAQPGTMAAGSGGGGGQNSMGMMGMNMNAVNAMTAMGSNPFAAMGNASNMLSNMPRAGAGGGPVSGMNLNYDVLQSFMQRNNPDGNNGPGMGPS
ncbi:hypothetical protein D9756_003233 [Leucocoprinus leucothites]|uniref:Mediator of RNA polymerase II transcription subunit 25 von Willebrand factor type A domain-containing protein n=1 Tax=Leucocoprinus leucothites TaxID=201217 RepID=A0A8H5G6L4_9AGAR|nr:hypothetical protein D9756_003233 [Leucoagaricus leucothites]